MLTPDIVVVCRFNQARSIVIGAMLRHLFPNLNILTCGIEAEQGSAIPEISASLCFDWGLIKFDRTSNSYSILEEVRKKAKIIAVDPWVFDQLVMRFPEHDIENLYDYMTDSTFQPVDPTGFSPNKFREEIAKACVLAIKLVNNSVHKKALEIKGSLFRSPITLDDYARQIMSKNDHSKVLIDTEFAYPDPDFWISRGFRVLFFNPRKPDVSSFEDNRNNVLSVLVSRFEIDQPVELILSPTWKTFLESVSSTKKVELICRDFKHAERQTSGVILALHSDIIELF